MLLGSGKAIFVMGIFQLASYLNYTCNFVHIFNLIPKLICFKAPPSASPDCTLAHNCVNNCVVSARYRRAFCVMHGLRP
jgi:hypothetical protein